MFVKIPHSFVSYLPQCKEFMMTLLYLWIESDYLSSGAVRFTLKEISELVSIEESYRKIRRIRQAISILVKEGLLTLVDIEDINAIKPMQLIKARLDSKKLYDLESNFVMISEKNIKSLLLLGFISDSDPALAINVLYLIASMAKGYRASFRISRIATTLGIEESEAYSIVKSLASERLIVKDNSSDDKGNWVVHIHKENKNA